MLLGDDSWWSNDLGYGAEEISWRAGDEAGEAPTTATITATSPTSAPAPVFSVAASSSVS